MNIKTSIHLLSVLTCSASIHAAILINNFDTVDLNDYTSGASFGSAILGNASSTDTHTVGATSGVNGSRGLTAGGYLLRSAAFADRSTTTNFSMYFKFNDDGGNQVNNAFVGAGWATTAGADGEVSYGGTTGTRFQVGLAQRGESNSENEVEFAAISTLSGGGTAITGTPEITLDDDTWYQLSFDLSYNSTDSNFDVANLYLYNWGADGVTGGSVVASIASASDLTVSGGASNSTRAGHPDAETYAIFNGNSGRGLAAFDNLSVTAIPEPSSILFVLVAGLGLWGLRRRH